MRELPTVNDEDRMVRGERGLPTVRDVGVLEDELFVRLFMEEMGEKLIPARALPMDVMPSLVLYHQLLLSKLGMIEEIMDLVQQTDRSSDSAVESPCESNIDTHDSIIGMTMSEDSQGESENDQKETNSFPLELIDNSADTPKFHTQVQTAETGVEDHLCLSAEYDANQEEDNVEAAMDAKRKRLVACIKSVREGKLLATKDRACILQ